MSEGALKDALSDLQVNVKKVHLVLRDLYKDVPESLIEVELKGAL